MEVKNYQDLMEARGMDPEMVPKMWGRAVEKYCDAVIHFMYLESAGKDIDDEVRIVRHGDGVRLEGECDAETAEFLQFKADNDWTLEKYEAKLAAYAARASSSRIEYVREGDCLLVRYRHQVRAEYRKVHWDDMEREQGPEGIVGVGVNSNVFGSDIEIEIREFVFPFDSDEFEAAVQDVVEEADFYYERDNSRYFRIKHRNQDAQFAAYNAAGEWTGVEDVPPKLLDKLLLSSEDPGRPIELGTFEDDWEAEELIADFAY
jgi:hypothetical protein